MCNRAVLTEVKLNDLRMWMNVLRGFLCFKTLTQESESYLTALFKTF